MRISYKKYGSSGLATFVSLIGALLLYLGVAWMVIIIAMSVQGVEDDGTGLLIVVALMAAIVGALLRFKIADAIAEHAGKRHAARRNRNNGDLYEKRRFKGTT